MRNLSENLLAAMQYKAFMARITLDGWEVVQNDPQGAEPIQNIHFSGGTAGDTGVVTMGSTVASSVTVHLEKDLVDFALEKREMFIELGMALPTGEEWFGMGTYTVTDVQRDDDTVTVTGMDAIVSKLDTEYEDIEGFDFESEEGVSSIAFVSAVCQRFGLTADLDGLKDHSLSVFSPDGCTWRQLLGFIAALDGRFVYVSPGGTLRFLWYQDVDVLITADDYYEGGLRKASSNSTVLWLKCYNEVLEETLSVGSDSEDQGIYFTSPWMTPEILSDLWAEISGYSFMPVPELTFFGDPRLEIGDAVRLVCLDGEICRVPIMGISHDWDGGLITSISSAGQNRSDIYEGPVQRETKRAVAKILKRAASIEMSVEGVENEVSYLQLQADEIEGRVEDAEGNLSQLQVTAEELSAKAEDAAGNISDLQVRADEISAEVKGHGEDLTSIKQTAGQVSVEAQDEGGTLKTAINPTAWFAERTDKDGNVTSSFRFDFASGQFIYDGTGKFMSPDGKSYITVDGGSFVLYAQDAYGSFVDIARIGFSEDSEGADYPYMLLGNPQDTEEGKLSLVKAFANGIYIGNAVPKLSTGNFIGLPGAVGFFVDMVNQKTYNVVGEELYDAFTAVFG